LTGKITGKGSDILLVETDDGRNEILPLSKVERFVEDWQVTKQPVTAENESGTIQLRITSSSNSITRPKHKSMNCASNT